MLMKANYGHKWTSNLATDQDVKITARLWLYHFHQYNKDVLHTALAYAFQQYDWPPTVKQFRTEIRAVLREQQALELLLLPAPERRSGLSDTARKHLDKLKSSLGLT